MSGPSLGDAHKADVHGAHLLRDVCADVRLNCPAQVRTMCADVRHVRLGLRRNGQNRRDLLANPLHQSDATYDGLAEKATPRTRIRKRPKRQAIALA